MAAVKSMKFGQKRGQKDPIFVSLPYAYQLSLKNQE